MTGRDLFNKYGPILKIIIRVASIFPYSFRNRRFSAVCMKRGHLGQLKRYIWISTLAKHVGSNVVIFPGVYFEHIEKLTLGDNVSIHQMCYIDAGGEIEIGNDVAIAHRTTILSSNHRYSDPENPIKYQGMEWKKTIINDNVWIGCASTILPGVSIGSGSVIGANSVVTKCVESNSVVVGNPAKTIKKRIVYN